MEEDVVGVTGRVSSQREPVTIERRSMLRQGFPVELILHGLLNDATRSLVRIDAKVTMEVAYDQSKIDWLMDRLIDWVD